MPPRLYRWVIFSLAAFVFLADQASKYGMFRGLYVPGQPSGSMEVIPGAFKFLVQFDKDREMCDCAFVKLNGPVMPLVNHGALFSLGGQFKGNANTFFLVVSILAALGITIWSLRRSTGQDRWLCWALGMILGGTFGNLYDRIVFGGVRDFLYFYLIDWPVFNVADCGLVCGAIMLVIQALFFSPPATQTDNGATGSPAGVPAPAPVAANPS
jgi:signal peptidase II